MAAVLCVIVDCNAASWGRLVEENQDDSLVSVLITALTSFCNAHLAQNAQNHLLVLATDHLLRDSEMFASSRMSNEEPTSFIRTNLRKHLTESAQAATGRLDCPLARPLAKALCYINRIKNQFSGENRASATFRILVMTLSEDKTEEHLKVMNLALAGQKQCVLMDVCSLSQPSAVLQQAADITNGLYLLLNEPAALLQYFLTWHLATSPARYRLVMPCSADVDYRPACRCHQKLISIGWVCSVCLSVFCHFIPICQTCRTVFNVQMLSNAKKRKCT